MTEKMIISYADQIALQTSIIREMTKVPGVLYVGRLRPPTPNRITRGGWDELWFAQYSPFNRLIKRFKLLLSY